MKKQYQKNTKKREDIISLFKLLDKEGNRKLTYNEIGKAIAEFKGDDGKPHRKISRQRVEIIINEFLRELF